MTVSPIYLDYNATTPVDPAVAEEISRSLRELWGNPSSIHTYGREAHIAINKARIQVAELMGAEADEILFTGGGSEASNLAIKGTCLRPRPRLTLGTIASWWRARAIRPTDCHIILSTVEHPATANPVDFLYRLGASVTRVRVDRQGMIDPDDVARAIRFTTCRHTLVTIMHSNNEVGTLMPIREIGELKRKYDFVFHTDCAQSLGKVEVNVRDLNVDMLTVAGHKLYAPKGIGVLYVRRGLQLEPLLHGAGHEQGRRAGTENTPYIVGLGKAAELARLSLPGATARLASLRDRLHQQLQSRLGDRVVRNGHAERCLPNTLNVNFRGQVGADLLARLPGIAASTGSACHEGKVSQSPVLCAMGVPPELGQGAVRMSVGRWTTEAEIDKAVEQIQKAID